MQTLTLYASTTITFLALDAVMLNVFMAPLFRKHLGDRMLAVPKLGAAAVFYLFYIAGLVVLISRPALLADAPLTALWQGALLGAIAYGTYEMTNYATLRDWSVRMVVADWAWGTALTATAAWVGVTVTRWLFPL